MATGIIQHVCGPTAYIKFPNGIMITYGTTYIDCPANTASTKKIVDLGVTYL